MIPKKIHYIWLGGKPLPELAEKCIASWKNLLPDYQIIRWDETNLNIDICKYCKQAYQANKFAFCSDVLRFDVLNREGGIYLDIDVEVIKPLDKFLSDPLFSGFENKDYVAPGLILGSTKNHPLLETMLKVYENKNFNIKNLAQDTVCMAFTRELAKMGLKKNDRTQKLSDGTTIYSSDYFHPINFDTKQIKLENAYTIHHYAGTWVTKCKFGFIKKIIKSIIGKKNVNKLRERKRARIEKKAAKTKE